MTAPAPQRSGALLEVVTVAGLAVLSLALGVVIILLVSDQPAQAVQALLLGAVANPFQLGTMLARAVPYIFAGLAVAIAFRASVFNIGVEGQLYIGALSGTFVALQLGSVPAVLAIPAVLLAAAAGGGAYAAVAGYLKAALDADEIVVTLMLNFVAVLAVSYLVSGPLLDPEGAGLGQTAFVPASTQLPRFFPPSRLHIGLLIALALAGASWLLLYRTTWGYELRISGLNPEFARYGGISPRRAIVLSMVFSGALAGVGGVVQVTGELLRLIDDFSPGYGFVGILIALLARNNPLLVPPAAIFYSYLVTGAQVMEETTDVPREVVILIQAVLFLVIGAQALFGWLRRRRSGAVTADPAGAGGRAPTAEVSAR